MNKLKIVSLFMSSFLMISAFSAPLITKANPEVNKLQEEKKQITEEKEIKKESSMKLKIALTLNKLSLIQLKQKLLNMKRR